MIDGAQKVAVDSSRREAKVMIPNGNTTYPLTINATGPNGERWTVQRTIEYHPGGGDGSITIR